MAKGKFFSALMKAGLPCLALVVAACATVPAAPQPEWVRDPYTSFNRQAYLAVVGSGGSRQAAEMDALGRLAAIFGTAVQVSDTLAESYRNAVSGGAVSAWTHEVALDRTIEITAGMNLIGAEIRDFWEDGRGGNHALAVLNRADAVRIYSQMLRANLQIIDNLTALTVAERNTIDAFARYQFAAVFADMNASYAAVLTVVGAPQYAQGLRSGDDFRLEAREIVRAIPIEITVQNDRAGRIQGAFARVFSDIGFRSGGASPRYVLDVDVNIQPVDNPGAQFLFTRIELAANLVDTETGTVLLPFTFNLREGHLTLAEAENRAFRTAEQRINVEYRNMLSRYLSRLIPGL